MIKSRVPGLSILFGRPQPSRVVGSRWRPPKTTPRPCWPCPPSPLPRTQLTHSQGSEDTDSNEQVMFPSTYGRHRDLGMALPV